MLAQPSLTANFFRGEKHVGLGAQSPQSIHHIHEQDESRPIQPCKRLDGTMAASTKRAGACCRSVGAQTFLSFLSAALSETPTRKGLLWVTVVRALLRTGMSARRSQKPEVDFIRQVEHKHNIRICPNARTESAGGG